MGVYGCKSFIGEARFNPL